MAKKKKKYYTVYCSLLPKQNVWLKYIKSKIFVIINYDKTIVNFSAKHFL